MQIRKAKKEDKVSQLILLAAVSVFNEFKGVHNVELANFLFKSENNKFSYENTIVLEENGQIIGVLIGYDSEKEKELATNEEKILFEKYNLKFKVNHNESLANSFYIDTAAIDSTYQGKGLVNELLNYVKNENQNLSLLVDINNEPAKKSYLKNHFKIIEETDIFGGKYLKMLYEK